MFLLLACTTSTLILYNPEDPEAVRTHCPVSDGYCQETPLAHSCAYRAGTVIAAGHTSPPTYLGVSAEKEAEALLCPEPNMIVFDTCYGFSLEPLQALSDLGFRGQVVGAIKKLPPAGLKYAPEFFQAPRWDRVQSRSGESLNYYQVNPYELRQTQQILMQWGHDELEAHLVRKHPNLVRLPLGHTFVVAEVPPARFRR